ncbi:hypothetical protein OHA25_23170 [Nonomuraea sp. NBC_00507]|uniref:hypothetical protein n=1 Tax=Nonomuraea sp. NBC_00507 TaxID=2976002 RepID=UPI002E189780
MSLLYVLLALPIGTTHEGLLFGRWLGPFMKHWRGQMVARRAAPPYSLRRSCVRLLTWGIRLIGCFSPPYLRRPVPQFTDATWPAFSS